MPSFNKCISHKLYLFNFGRQEVLLGLLSSKTVIYVTHQVEFLPAADLILVSNTHLFSSLHVGLSFHLVHYLIQVVPSG
jgi:hypothetical protein